MLKIRTNFVKMKKSIFTYLFEFNEIHEIHLRLYNFYGMFKSRVAESEVFGWNRIPKDTRSRSRIFLSDSGSPTESFLHRTPKLRILTVEIFIHVIVGTHRKQNEFL